MNILDWAKGDELRGTDGAVYESRGRALARWRRQRRARLWRLAGLVVCGAVIVVALLSLH